MRFKTMISAAIGLGAMAAVANAGGSSPVFNIQGDLHGDWQLNTTPSFVPGSQGGHFGFDTLVVQETAPTFVPGTVPIPAQPWADLWIQVDREPGATGTMIAVDKTVVNATPVHWTDFHMELGTGIGDAFQPFDNLEFKTDPGPVEETGAFPNPPMTMGSGNSLWWLQDDKTPGVWPQFTAQFWVGIAIPDNLFEPSATGGFETAMFTLRQHWTPTPGAAGVFALAGISSLRRRRRV